MGVILVSNEDDKDALVGIVQESMEALLATIEGHSVNSEFIPLDEYLSAATAADGRESRMTTLHRASLDVLHPLMVLSEGGFQVKGCLGPSLNCLTPLIFVLL